MPKFTVTEERILKMLRDGQRHTKYELVTAINPNNLNSYAAMAMHISNIRKKLRPVGEDIICELSGRIIHYRHVRLISYD